MVHAIRKREIGCVWNRVRLARRAEERLQLAAEAHAMVNMLEPKSTVKVSPVAGAMLEA